MPMETTIKVTKALRERITTAARAESSTVNDFLGGLMAEYERSQRMAAAAIAMRTAPPEVMEEYQREFRQWERAALDDLDPR